MEQFSEEHTKLLLNKEWLAKTGTENSTSKPYLFKFCSSTVDLSCLVLITDTKSVWVENLNSNQFSRRWRECNSLPLEPVSSGDEEEEWRESTLKSLTAAHTVGGMTDISFEVVESRYSDFAFTLECKSFKWRWETCFIGHKLGSEIISQHLVLPLISVNHLAFTSADALGEVVESELEKGIDKVGRSARRAIDTHIKNAISKPRLASTLRRMTAMYNFLPDLPSVISTAETPKLDPPLPPVSAVLRKQSRARAPSPKRLPSPPPLKAEGRSSSPGLPTRPPRSPKAAPRPKQTSRLDRWTPSPEPLEHPKSPKVASPKASTQPLEGADSATESDDEEEVVPVISGKGKASETGPVVKPDGSPPPTRSISPAPGKSSQASRPRKSSSQSESSPQRPAKKKKTVASPSSDDSEGDTSRRAPAKSGTSTGVKRGTRQPIKRGGKRF